MVDTRTAPCVDTRVDLGAVAPGTYQLAAVQGLPGGWYFFAGNELLDFPNASSCANQRAPLLARQCPAVTVEVAAHGPTAIPFWVGCDPRMSRAMGSWTACVPEEWLEAEADAHAASGAHWRLFWWPEKR